MARGPIGLVLTGGGGRSAYQAGALQLVGEVAAELGQAWPFSILAGTSAGAINVAFLAQRLDDFSAATVALGQLWGGLSTSQVYRTDLRALARNGLRWLGERSLGAWAPHGPRGAALLDTSPLRALLVRELSSARLERNLAGRLRGLAVNVLDYCCGVNRTFVASSQVQVAGWARSRRRGQSREIGLEEVLASAAIPVLFPPVVIDGHPCGDGAVRNYAPLSAPIKLGAERLLVIGVRQPGRVQEAPSGEPPSLGRVASVLLNSTLLDGVDLDLERLEMINHLLSAGASPSRDLRPVEACVLRPALDLGQVAAEEAHHMPFSLRHLIRGLGRGAEVSDLISYLLFEASYAERLRRLGYADALARRDELREFLAG